MRSLRRTLAARFSLTIFCAVILIGIGVFTTVRWFVLRELDRGLAGAMGLESAVLAAGLPIAFEQQSTDINRFIDRVNRFVAVRDSAGRIVTSNTPLAAALPMDPDAFDRARAGGGPVWATHDWEGRPMRSVFAPAPSGSASRLAVLQVAASLGLHRRAQAAALGIIVAVVVFATLAAGVGSMWLASSALAPIATITEQAAAINPRTTGQRITAHGDVQELSGLIRVLNHMVERLEVALDAQRRIIADVAHELRTPLTSLQGSLEIALRSERTPEHYREILDACLDDARHLSAVNEALVLLARLEAGEIRVDSIPVDLGDVATEAVMRVRGASDEHGFDAPAPNERRAVASGEPTLLGMMLDHLLDNVVKHTPPGTHASVGVRHDDGDVVVTVNDDGPGLPAEMLPLLFDRLYRADAARTRGHGAGLGLSIAGAIAAVHGGRIRADLVEEGGLRVTVSLPARGSPSATRTD